MCLSYMFCKLVGVGADKGRLELKVVLSACNVLAQYVQQAVACVQSESLVNVASKFWVLY